MNKVWSENLPVTQFRVARPTNQLQKLLEFYRDGVGLKEIGSFEGHNGYDGIMLGLPDASYHLEFTQHVEGSPCPVPTKDNLLVFYFPDKDARDNIVHRLNQIDYKEVAPENPYWKNVGVTVEDPDGWRIVLRNSYTLDYDKEVLP